MSRAIVTVFGRVVFPIALAVLAAFGLSACSTRLTAPPAGPCYTDADCGAGHSCNPFTRTCQPAPTLDSLDSGAPDSTSLGSIAPDSVAPDSVAPDSVGDDAEAPNACPAGAVCNDQNPCTADDRCSNDNLCAGQAYSCDDGFDCTLDLCDGLGACTWKTAPDACFINGICHQRQDKNPANSCEVCLPSASQSAWTANDALTCPAIDACHSPGQCVSGICQAGPPQTCDDAVDCTTDTCDPQAGCTQTPNDAACDDNDPCTTDTCDTDAGGCTHSAIVGCAP